MLDEKILQKVNLTFELLKSKKLKLATAESCTGGLVSAYITSICGSSVVFDRGFVTYSNQSKIDLLNVPLEYIEKFGAVSKQVAISMAEGALKMSESDIAISITGIAGPKSDGSEKKVGGVHFALAKTNEKTQCYYQVFDGNRDEVRKQAVLKSFEILQN